ncbi:MAG: FtsX-like permease family protein [Candidatus Abawacabacteria bacterium]|nr:FtsX-like permease family protein [Candidatus Abawacabacteria bacterium]
MSDSAKNSQKVYLQVTSLKKEPSIASKGTTALHSVWQSAKEKSIKLSTKIKSQLFRRKHFSAIGPQAETETHKTSFTSASLKTLRELRRNFLRSVATVFIMALVLTTIGTAIIVSFITEEAIRIVNAKLDVSIEVQENVPLEKVQTLIKEIEILPAIRSVTYISKNDALEIFRKDHPDLTEFLQTYNINNPLPALIRINVKDPKDYQEVLNFLDRRENSTIINLTKARDNFSERSRIEQLIGITDTVKYFLYFFITLFIVIGVLIIVATVQLSLQQRKRELSIMQVVGASFRRILSPFIWESVLLSIFSTLLASAVLVAIAVKLTPLTMQYFDSPTVNIVRFLEINALPITTILLGAALGISLIVTLLTAWRYLRSQRLF